MCGLVGQLSSVTRKSLDVMLTEMSDAISHRGPDDSGIWSDANAGIGLSHRRLSIVDLSSAGHQPMRSASGRYVVVFNGEIYNHLKLRKELDTARQAYVWRGILTLKPS